MIEWLKAQGAQVIEVDTDGIYFVPPNEKEIDKLQRGLAQELPPGIEVEFDEQFDAMFSYKAKNYALLTRDGEVVIKGGALKSRGLEKFQRVFLEEMIKLLMEEKPEGIPQLRDEFAQKIREREWPIEMVMKTDTLQDSLEKYRQKIAAGGEIAPPPTSLP
jgi:DNA polymerase elongation subunit (family B)